MSKTQSPDPAPTWQAVREFLTGAAPLDGVWFGEPHPTRKGMFWWRDLLPAADSPAPEGAPDLRAAALAVLTRWDSPLWRQEVGTAELMAALRAALAAPAPQAPAWQPIETAPKDGREMFVVRAFGIDPTGGATTGNYTSDAYAVFRGADGRLVRWPHIWPPTHWMPLPAAPQTKEQP